MNDLITLYSEIKKDVQGLSKALAKITLSPSKRLAEEWNRKDEAMRILRISPRTLSRLTATGKLPFSKINGLVFIKTSDIEHLLNENYKKPITTTFFNN